MIHKGKFKVRQKNFKSFDGTRIAYQVVGNGKKVIFLCNGLGGNVAAWRPIFDHFGNDYTFITWDYRGLYKSDVPLNEKHVRIQDHIEDMHLLIKKEGIKKALLGGWSMGVQVCLEYYRKNPKVYTGMLLLHGTYGYPFETALNNPLSKYILPNLNELAKKYLPAVQPTLKPIAHHVIDSDFFITVASKLGLVNKNLNQEIFQEVAKEVMGIDFEVYHQIMEYLSKHDASDVLPKIKVPTLIIGGDQDVITPVKVSEKMAHDIPDAQLLIIPGGSHYAILEFPELINMRIKQFLKEYYPA